MKIYVKASQESYAPYHIHINTSENAIIDKDSIKSSLYNILAPAEDYISEVTVNLGNLSVCDIRVFSKHSRVKQCRVVGGKNPTEGCIATLLRKLSNEVSDFIIRNAEYENSDDKLHRNTIAAKIRKAIKMQFGVSPSFVYKHDKEDIMEYYPYDICKVVDSSISRNQGNREALNKGIEYLTSYLIDSGFNSEEFSVGYNIRNWILVTAEK